MGCCASQEEVQTNGDVPVTAAEAGTTELEDVRMKLEINEAEATKTKPGDDTFLASVLKARATLSDDADKMAECCTRLQALNQRLKDYVAIYDCDTVKEAMDGGFMGLGCNDDKLIAALCTRTKSQLARSRKTYRDKYDENLRDKVRGETGSGGYGRMMYFAMARPDEYIADIIDLACVGFGCDEVALLEVFVTHTQAELQAGKKIWEDRYDKHLVDYLQSELDGWVFDGHKLLRHLLHLLYTGDRVETDEVDEELAAQQVEFLEAECAKGWFQTFESSEVIEIIGKNTTAQNQLVAQLYEKKYAKSLAKSLKSQCEGKLLYALEALLLPKADFLAMRLNDAMKGWFTNKDILTRLLGGLDGGKMQGVAEAFERKYDQPLWSALKEEISGDFLTAASVWLNSVANDPARGAEAFTEQEVSAIGDDAAKLTEMLDWLLLENEALMTYVAYLDIESIREAVKGYGADQTRLIRSFTTRNKRALARVNIGYRNKYGETLQKLIESEMGDTGFYPFLAKFLVVQAEQADLMILDTAMNDATVDHEALVEFLCARHPRRVRAAKEKWEAFHDDNLVDMLADNLSGDMQSLALRMLKGKRDVDNDDVDHDMARKQAHQLHDGAIDYIETLCDNSSQQNALCAKYYEEAYDTSLKRAISQEYSGPVKKALLALLQGPVEWYAAQLRGALQGAETNEKVVCRILGAHDKEEIKKIAAAFERKYNEPLTNVLSAKCKGDYKRLAVAWVDLPDQLAQPDKIVSIPTMAAVEEAGAESRAQTHETQDFDDEISEDDENFENDLSPDSPLFKAKCKSWMTKYIKYRDMGKDRKKEHYQRLLLLNPPVPSGHKILRGFCEALEEEYKNDEQGEDWTGMWLDTVSDSEFDDVGTTKEFFKEWFDVTESMVAEKKVTVAEMKGHWGLNDKPLAKEVTYDAAPLAQAVPAFAQPVAQPAYPQAQPAYPQATPVYGTNYPQAQPMPMMQPGMPMMQPGMPMMQPGMPMMQPGMPMMPSPYGNPYGMPMGQTTSTTTTTTTSYVQSAPMMMGAPQMVVYR